MTSNSLPYYRRFARDFLEGTAGLGFETKAAYGVILDLIYLHNGALPDSHQMIAGQLECSVRKWNIIRSDLIAKGKIRVENGAIRNFRADKEEIIRRTFQDNQAEKGRKSADKRAENSDNRLKQMEMQVDPVGYPVATEGPTGNQPNHNHIQKKEEEGVRASARDFGFSEGEQDPLVARVMAAVGLAEDEAPRFWIGDQAAAHVRAWGTQHGLTEAEIVAEAAKSRKKNPEPPDGPKGLDRWMEQAGAAKKSALGVRSNSPAAAPAKPPTSPIDRLSFYADWIKDMSKSMPPSTISNTLRDALLSAKMVTPEDLRARGIR